jgi:hypothetical protein
MCLVLKTAGKYTNIGELRGEKVSFLFGAEIFNDVKTYLNGYKHDVSYSS